MHAIQSNRVVSKAGPTDRERLQPVIGYIFADNTLSMDAVGDSWCNRPRLIYRYSNCQGQFGSNVYTSIV